MSQLTDEQIKQVVDRFLRWELPTDFSPDNGITFDPIGSRGTPYEYRRKPLGTNLLTAAQAEEMVRFILEQPKAGAFTAEEQAALQMMEKG